MPEITYQNKSKSKGSINKVHDSDLMDDEYNKNHQKDMITARITNISSMNDKEQDMTVVQQNSMLTKFELPSSSLRKQNKVIALGSNENTFLDVNDNSESNQDVKPSK